MDVLRWAVRQPRVWAAGLAVGVVVALAAPDGRAHFARFVPAAAVAAWLAIRQKYGEDFPRPAREERRRQRFEAEVAEILRRDAERRAISPQAPPGQPPAPLPRDRAARRAARQQAEVEAILWRYERQRLERARARR